MSETFAAVRAAHWVDPASVFAALFAQEPHAFWLDAGPGAAEGWSWMGTGMPDDPANATATVCSGESGGDADLHGVPFRSGWVGWTGYDDAAARAGAPSSRDADGVPQDLWLRVDRLVAFDHGEERIHVFGGADDVSRVVAALGAVPPRPGRVRRAHRTLSRRDPRG